MVVNISSLDDFGRGISYDLDKICFVPFTMPDDIVDISIVKSKKKYYEGKVLSFLKKNEKRLSSVCPKEGVCGGCQVSFLSSDLEDQFKILKFTNIMHKFAKIDNLDVSIESSNRLNYRNKITLSCGVDGLGLMEISSLEVVPIDRCFLVDDKINEVIFSINSVINPSDKIDKVVIKLGNKTNEVLVSINGVLSDSSKFLEFCDVLYVNDVLISKKDKIMSYILDKRFLVSNKSFFQVNYDMTNKLYSYIISIIKRISSVRVLDLYCGVGTIGISISSFVQEVYGIEIVKEAILMADCNKKINNVKNIRFSSGDVSSLINGLEENYDTYILDPPRSGVSDVVISNILLKKPSYIIYVSCNPITLARDVKLLSEFYEVSSVKLFNMFPRTYHVESVCVLKLR